MLLLTLDHRKKEYSHMRYLQSTKLMCLLASFFQGIFTGFLLRFIHDAAYFFHDNDFVGMNTQKPPFRTRDEEGRGKLFAYFLQKRERIL